MIDEMREKLREKSCVMQNIDNDEKENALNYHTETL